PARTARSPPRRPRLSTLPRCGRDLSIFEQRHRSRSPSFGTMTRSRAGARLRSPSARCASAGSVGLLAIHLLSLAALLLRAPASADDPAAGWTPGRTAAGPGYAYQLFSKQVEGEAFARFRVDGTIDAAPDALVRAFRVIVTDPARAPDGQTRRV